MSIYETKKKQCKERMIGFDFTKEQWTEFNKLKCSVTCAYTNITFSKVKESDEYPTVERIDESKPYSVSNCVFVTVLANRLKNRYIELGHSEDNLIPHHKGYLTRIRRIISSVQNIQEIQKPYKHLFGNTTKQTKKETDIMSGITTKNKEIQDCYDYVIFGGDVETKLGQELNISFAQYKRLVGKKKCSLSGVEFSEYDKPTLWVMNKTCEVDVGNVLVVSTTLKVSLDKFAKENSFSTDTLKQVCTVLSKKL